MKLVINERLKGKKLYREKWKDITIKGATYRVSSLGRIFGKRGELKQRLNKDGYLEVSVGKKNNRSSARVHRLVMMAFRPCEGMENLEVDHIDTCRTKNKLSNLRWVTREGNMNNSLTRQHLSEVFKGSNNPMYGKTGELAPCYGRTGEKHPMNGKHHTKEAKAKISEASIENAKNNPNYGMKGKHHSEETKAKISKKCVCIETGIVYYSTKEAKIQTGICDTSIQKCCRGKQQTAGGYHWKYYEEVV